MKTKIFILVFLLVFIIISLTGCKKELVDPNQNGSNLPKETSPKEFLVTTSANPGGSVNPVGTTIVKSGSSVIVSISSDSSHKISSIKIDGIDQTIEDTLKLDNILNNKNIVVDFVSKKALLLSDRRGWKTKFSRVYQNGKLVWDDVLSEKQKDYRFYYFLSGKYGCAIDSISDININSSSSWALSKDEKNIYFFSMDGKNMEEELIIKLTIDTLNIDTPGTFYGKPAIYEDIYTHP